MERGQPRLTTLHLIRHAAHGLLGRVLAGRMPGVGLSAEGLAQADRLAAALQARPIAGVFTSPVERARQTAAPIAARFGLAPVTEPELDEIDFGAWTGQTFDALAPDPAWAAWNGRRSLGACPGGETMLAAQARAVACVRRLAAAFPTAELALVSHQDVLKAVLAHLLGLSLDQLDRFALDPASRSVVELTDGWAQVSALNLPA